MPTKLIHADFYLVKVEDKEKRVFCDLLRFHSLAARGYRKGQQRTECDPNTVHDKGACGMEFQMLRIRLNESHVRAKLSGETAELELDEDEGLGEETAFVFHHVPGILIVQRNRSGVTASAFANNQSTLQDKKHFVRACAQTRCYGTDSENANDSQIRSSFCRRSKWEAAAGTGTFGGKAILGSRRISGTQRKHHGDNWPEARSTAKRS